ncbi:MAG: CheB methylesterase domain-containing protein, partial [Paenibacillus macerans]|nr:CheB methylesterase domain-containing protein [Paenibacillus macerans]
ASARQDAPAAPPKPPLEPAQAETAAAREAAGGSAARSRPRNAAAKSFTDLVAIGTSTGGPKALKAVLEKIPADFPAPIVIVQHMPPNFTKSLAQRLNSLSELNVVEAEEGMELLGGTAYIAPGGFHLNVVPGPAESYRLHLSQEEPCNGHRPSVDVLYKSLFPLESLKRHIVLLTGMGSDGAKAMKRLYDAGVTSTIAESEETCVVFGMPRSAIELNCVSHVLPLHEIGPKLVQVVK